MANRVRNRMIVDLVNKDKIIRENEVDFTILLPIPKDSKSNSIWCKENWGCYLNADTLSWNEVNNKLEIIFDTKSAPPYKWFEYLSSQKIDFKCYCDIEGFNSYQIFESNDGVLSFTQKKHDYEEETELEK